MIIIKEIIQNIVVDHVQIQDIIQKKLKKKYQME